MGWRCITSDCSVKIFSISAELKSIIDSILSFAFGMAPGVYAIMIFFVIATFILYLFYYVKRVIAGEV